MAGFLNKYPSQKLTPNAFLLVSLTLLSAPFLRGDYMDSIYDYIEDVSVFSENQMQGHSPDIRFDTLDESFSKDRKDSPYQLCLNGKWKFRYCETPEEAPRDFYQINYRETISDWHDIDVPSNWEMVGFGDPQFRNIAQPFKANPPYVPRDYNPTGLYRKTFELPADWDGQHVFLRMEKTASASFVWLNGKEVGYNEGAHEPAEYDITPFLKKGENTLAVCVVKFSDGVYLEDQDYWRLSGIFGDVWLYATPETHIFDWQAITDLDDNYEDAELTVKTIVNHYGVDDSDTYRLRISLLDAQKALQTWTSDPFLVSEKGRETIEWKEWIENPLKWTAETPNLYHLGFELVDSTGKTVEAFSNRIGFKETEIRGQVFFLNGEPIKLNGINSHMQHPVTGHRMDEETMRKDLELMKQFNINCVRTSHYPPEKRYLELADEYGIYVIDETGDECHATEFLSYDSDWIGMYRERVRQLVLRDRNHPSILFWSAGNESGEGPNICEVIDEGMKWDATRSWMYGGNAFAHDCEQIIGPRYPSPLELVKDVGLITEEQDPRPSFMDEYLSVAGNGGGGLDEYWDIIYEYPRIMGGAIWDYVSPGLLQPVRALKDSSAFDHATHIMGNAFLTDGHRGKGLDLNGHDQWIEIYQSKDLDLDGDQLTLALWVYPRELNGSSGYFISKGNHQFGLQQRGEDALAFYLFTDEHHELVADLPENWVNRWHHLAATYDGEKMKIFVDGREFASKRASGDLHNFPFPVNIGRNVQAHGQETDVHMVDAILDDVLIADTAVEGKELMDLSQLPEAIRPLLQLEFESDQKEGEFFSYGLGARTYGSIWPDREVQPEMYQIKKSAQPMKVSWLSKEQQEVLVLNRNFFTNLDAYDFNWALQCEGENVQEGTLKVAVAPQSQKAVAIPFDPEQLVEGSEYFLTLSLRLFNDASWANKGHVVGFEQLKLQDFHQGLEVDDPLEAFDQLSVDSFEDHYEINGGSFSYTLSKVSGTFSSLKIGGEELLQNKKGPKFNVWRAPVANELDEWAGYYIEAAPVLEGYDKHVAGEWLAYGIDQLSTETVSVSCKQEDDCVRVRVLQLATMKHFPSNGFENRWTYDIHRDGSILIDHEIIPHGNMPDWLPCIGIELELAEAFQHVEWYGRGPQENYPDRKTGYPVGVYSSTVHDMYEPYLIPQESGKRSDTRWMELTNANGFGLRFESDDLFQFSVSRYTIENQTRAKYPFQLAALGGNTLSIDYKTTGVGCTARSVFNQYQTLAAPIRRSVLIRPVN